MFKIGCEEPVQPKCVMCKVFSYRSGSVNSAPVDNFLRANTEQKRVTALVQGNKSRVRA